MRADSERAAKFAVGVMVTLALIGFYFTCHFFFNLGGKMDLAVACVWAGVVLLIAAGVFFVVYQVQTNGFEKRKRKNDFEIDKMRLRNEKQIADLRASHTIAKLTGRQE